MPTDGELRRRGQAGGLKGGRARADKLSSSRRSEIASIAAKERWALVRMRKAMLDKRREAALEAG
ncbi:MAG: hypothetical protein V3S55_09620 [Nitrospiraceae bacterium]